MRIVCQSEMKEIEQVSSDKYFFTESMIVEQVGTIAAQQMMTYYQKHLSHKEIIFLIGKGNNGSDGLAICRQLFCMGVSCKALLLFDEKELSLECKTQLARSRAFGVRTYKVKEIDELASFMTHETGECVFVDAIFGTGVRLPLSQFMYEVIDYVNNNAALTISIDIPTGVDGDTGLVQGNAIKADLTLAIGFPKLGYYVAQGAELVGEVSVVDVTFPPAAFKGGNKFLLTRDNLPRDMISRSKFADKKNFGHSLVMGGSHGLTGALVMSSLAALKVGTGLVTATTWENQYQELLMRLAPEIMTGYIPLDQTKWPRLLKNINRFNSIVIGPGLARSIRARQLVLEILNNFTGPVILDADAINVLKMDEDKHVFSMRSAPTVLTPHLGEFSRFTNIPFEKIVQSPVEYLKEVVNQTHCSIVLKGPCSYIGLTSGPVYFNFFPNDGMATGGVGDVLAGILGGLLAQNSGDKQKQTLTQIYEKVNNTILFGVYFHSLAGKNAVEKFGARSMTAMSIIDSFTESFKDLELEFLKGNQNG